MRYCARSAALEVVSQAESAVEEGSLEESYLVRELDA